MPIAAMVLLPGAAVADDRRPEEARDEAAEGTTVEVAVDPGPGAAPGEEPGAVVAVEELERSTMLYAGDVALHVAVAVGLSTGAAGDPVTVSPDLWYGVTDELTIGLAHSGPGLTGFWGGLAPTGFCLAGEPCELDALYRAGGLQAKLGIEPARAIGLAAIAGVLYDLGEPFEVGARLGVEAGWRSGVVAVEAQPSVYLAANQRAAANDDVVFVPVAVTVLVGPALQVGVQSGLVAPLVGDAGGLRVPLSLGATGAIGSAMTVGVALTLERIAGGAGPGPADLRSASLFLTWLP